MQVTWENVILVYKTRSTFFFFSCSKPPALCHLSSNGFQTQMEKMSDPN